MKFRMRVIPQPAEGTRAVVVVTGGEGNPAFRSKGKHSLECGDCGRVLAEKVDRGQIRGLVLGCPCGAFNDVDDVDPVV